jgi:hypothetical protein
VIYTPQTIGRDEAAKVYSNRYHGLKMNRQAHEKTPYIPAFAK